MTSEQLAELGAERLASILYHLLPAQPVVDAVTLALAELHGVETLSQEIAARLDALKHADLWITRRESEQAVAGITSLAGAIGGGLTRSDPHTAFELLRRLLGLAGHVSAHAEEGYNLHHAFVCATEAVGPVMAAMPGYGCVEDRAELMIDLLDLFDEDDCDLASGLIEAAAGALGREGSDALRSRLQWRLNNDDPGYRSKTNAQLRIIANLDGDVDAYIATLPPGVAAPGIVCDVACRLIDAGRAEEALTWLDRCGWPSHSYDRQWADLRTAALDQAGRNIDAHAMRWQAFERFLSEKYFASWIDALPKDQQAAGRDRAIAAAVAHPYVSSALQFLVRIGALAEADRIVRAAIRPFGCDDILRPVAEALSAEYPATAMTLYRQFIDAVLERPSRTRYPQAAADLRRCRDLALRCDEDARGAHLAYWDTLKMHHGRKRSFWFHVGGPEMRA